MNVTILDDLINSDDFRRITATEYAGPCPRCGGRDRFRIWKGRYWCRVCGSKGDEIQFLRDFRGMSYAEACRYLGREPKNRTGAYCKISRSVPAEWIPKAINPPPDMWKTKAKKFVDWAHEHLMEPASPGMDYLLKRGIDVETARRFRLGFNPSDCWRDKSDWGLPADGKRLWLPAGIIVPTFMGSDVMKIRTRRLSNQGPKYVCVSGSSNRVMVLNPGALVAVLAEAELDAVLLAQECGNQVCAVGLGSAQARPDSETAAFLHKKRLIINLLDSDQAGARESWTFWFKHFSNVARRPIPGFKDVGDAFKAGLPVADFIREIIRRSRPRRPPNPARADKYCRILMANLEKFEHRLKGAGCQKLFDHAQKIHWSVAK